MKCPKCNNPILPLKVLLISRWSFVKCNKCGSQWGRNIDLQGWIIFALLIIPLIAMRVSIFNPLFLVWAVTVTFIDAYTIKLVPKTKKKKMIKEI